MKKIRIGVVGVGRGGMMWKYCKDADNAQIVAICDNWEEGLKEAKEKLNDDTITYYNNIYSKIKYNI
jgi:predicted dehydrogenase